MKIALPCTWDFRFFEQFKKLQNTENAIAELYGSLKTSHLGSGHSSAAIRANCNNRKKIEAYVKTVHDHGLEFNYTINASCLGNREYHPKQKKKMIEELEWICSFSDSVTVTVPYLIQLVKQISGDKVKVAISTIVGIDRANLINRYEDLGANRVVLNINLNRNPEAIEKIRKETNIDLELLVNDSCLKDCPYRTYHYNSGSHASIHKQVFYLDYCVYHCLLSRLEHPEEILKSPWLRPEDCHNYSDTIDYIKIGGREKSFDWVWRATEAYAQGSYDGNILELLTIISPESHELGELLFQEGLKLTANKQQLTLYFEHFFQKHACSHNCSQCGYCADCFDQIISLDEDVLIKYKEIFKVLGKLLKESDTQGFFQHKLIKFAFEEYVKDSWMWRLMKRRIPSIMR